MKKVRMEKVQYGPDPAQYAEWSPVADARGIVVVVHGGYWRSLYDLSLGRPLAADLNRRGWSTLNLEYRRLGNGGGAPQTFDDVAAGINLLATLAPAYAAPIVALGHSAGGHLAAWAAGRTAHGWTARVALTHVISQAGVLDLIAAQRVGASDGVVDQLLAGVREVGEIRRFDPRQQIPLDVPVVCLHAPDDVEVPISQSRDYVAAARAAGAEAQLIEVTGGHFDLIRPDTDAWARVIAVLDALPTR